MRSIIFIGLLFGVMQISAQEKIEIHQDKRAINKEMQPAFVVDIPLTTSHKALKLWERTLVSKPLLYKFRRLPKMEKEANDKWVMHNVVVDKICPDSLDIYTRIIERNGKVTFAALFAHNGNFIGNEQNQTITKNTCSYVREYAIETYKQAALEEQEKLKKELNKMTTECAICENENKKMERRIEECKYDLTRLEKELTETKEILRNASIKIGETTAPLSKRRKKEFKKNEKKTNKKIKRVRNAIERYATTFDKNKTRQTELYSLIELKKMEIQKVTAKLNNIN